MSSNIPFEIQMEIIKRVIDVKPLLCFRSVSKTWKYFIDSSEFIAHHHSIRQTHQLLRYEVDSDYKYVSIADDDSFPQHKSYHVVPPTVKLIKYVKMFDCSHGLVCLYGPSVDTSFRNQIVIWNPLIRKDIGIAVPERLIAVGFGVCVKTMEPKVVKIAVDLKAEVFMVSTGAWRTIPMNLPLRYYTFNPGQVVVNGTIYWIAYNKLTGFTGNRIISFDLTSEEFGEVALPDALLVPGDSLIYKLKDSLALFNRNADALVFDLWIMIKNGDSNCFFEKLFKLAYDGSIFCDIYGFRVNGQSIMMVMYYDDNDDVILGETLKVYDPFTKQLSDLVIDVDDAVYDMSFSMTSYTESLLMLNQHATIF